MSYDALIFDLDGTLWDASAATAKGWTSALEKLGLKRAVTGKEIQSVSGKPYEECVDVLLPDLRDQIPDLANALNPFEKEAIERDSGVFYEGVLEGIRKLSENYKIFLVSNCQDWYMHTFLHFSGLAPVLSGVDCNGFSGLPKGEMLRRMKTQYSLKNPIYIGDTSGDENATRRADMGFAHVSYGFGTAEFALLRFDSFSELVEYFSSKEQAI